MGEIFKIPRAERPLPFAGERYTSAVSGEIELEHLHRYFLARSLSRGKDVIDIAAGEGYGTAILGQVARSVVGVELYADVLKHAASNHSRSNIRFLAADAHYVPLRDASFDVVVSFETLEHCSDGEAFLKELVRLLRPNGILLISSPDRDIYSPSGRPANPYHLREYTRREFLDLIGNHFPQVELYAQRHLKGSAILAASERAETAETLIFERRGTDYAEVDSELARAPYLLAVASQLKLPPAFSASLYVDDAESRGQLRVDQVKVQVFPCGPDGYSESNSVTTRIELGEWAELSLQLPPGSVNGPLRVDPSDCISLIRISSIRIVDATDNHILWNASDLETLSTIQLAGSSCSLPSSDYFTLFNYGKDAQLILPEIRANTQSLVLDIKLNVDENLKYVADLIHQTGSSATGTGRVSTTDSNGRQITHPLDSTVQLYPYGNFGYSEETSLKETVEVAHWKTVSFMLPEGAGEGPLRLDPSPFPSIIEIASAEISNADSGKTVWTMNEAAECGHLKAAGTAYQISAGRIPVFFSSGFDAQLLFPQVNDSKEPVFVELVMRIDADLGNVRDRLTKLEQENDKLRRSEEKFQRDAEQSRRYESENETLRQEIETSYNERLALVAETKLLAAEKLDAQREQREIAAANRELASAKETLDQQLRIILGPELYAGVDSAPGISPATIYETELESLRKRAERLQSELDVCRDTLSRLLRSKSWMVTEPARMLARFIRRHGV